MAYIIQNCPERAQDCPRIREYHQSKSPFRVFLWVKNMGKRVDIEKEIGKKYGRLTIIEYAGKNKHGAKMVSCDCDCGKTKTIAMSSILTGASMSCGCLNIKKIRDRSLKHGLSRHPLYHVYKAMISRCCNVENPRYSSYGGRGITVCDEWLQSFTAFYDFSLEIGWSKGLLIDREDNDKGYSPENCRFVGLLVSANNRKTISKGNSTGFRGVHRCREKFSVQVTISGYPKTRKGGFKTAEEAAKYRDNFIIQHGIKTPLNFPEIEAKP